MRSSKRLAENAKAEDIVLTEAEIARIDELSEQGNAIKCQ